MKERDPKWLADEPRQIFISGFLFGVSHIFNKELSEETFDLDDAIDEASGFYDKWKKAKEKKEE